MTAAAVNSVPLRTEPKPPYLGLGMGCTREIGAAITVAGAYWGGGYGLVPWIDKCNAQAIFPFIPYHEKGITFTAGLLITTLLVPYTIRYVLSWRRVKNSDEEGRPLKEIDEEGMLIEKNDYNVIQSKKIKPGRTYPKGWVQSENYMSGLKPGNVWARDIPEVRSIFSGLGKKMSESGLVPKAVKTVASKIKGAVEGLRTVIRKTSGAFGDIVQEVGAVCSSEPIGAFVGIVLLPPVVAYYTTTALIAVLQRSVFNKGGGNAFRFGLAYGVYRAGSWAMQATPDDATTFAFAMGSFAGFYIPLAFPYIFGRKREVQTLHQWLGRAPST